MRLSLLMVRKDLLRQLRSPLAMLAVLSFPVIFASLLAMTFGGSGQPQLPKVELLLEDHDGSLLSGGLEFLLASEQSGEFVALRKVGPGEGRALMEQGQASALLVVPEGFGQALRDGNPTKLELVRNPAQRILPEIAEQGLTILADTLSSASHVLREPLERLRPYLEPDAPAPTLEAYGEIALAFQEVIEKSGGLVYPPVITLESVQLIDEDETPSPAGGSIFLLVLPGISVWALFMLGDMAMRDILTESREGTLRRQLSAPLPARQIVIGKALYTAAMASISLVILATIGWSVSAGGIDLVGFVVLSMAIVLMVTGYSSIIYALARNDRQGSTISSVLLLIFAFIGGSFVQIESLPAAVRNFSPFTPFYWGTTGYSSLLHQAGLADVLLNIGVLAGVGATLLAIGAMLLERKVRRGLAT